jgi:hypothetical protein
MEFSPIRMLLFFTMLVLVWSCSNTFELTEKSGDIPVVYGMLSPNDTAVYIRVERAFTDAKTSALVLAKDVKQLYFDNATVKIKHVKSNKEFSLVRVDGNLEGYVREKGAFADAPNYLYKIKKSELTIIPGDQYKLLVAKNDGTLLTEATTTAVSVLKNDDITSPGPSASLAFSNNLDFKFKWISDSYSFVHDVSFIIYFKEEKDGKLTDKNVLWRVVTNTDKSEFVIKGRAFYDFMAGALEEKNPAIKRYFQSASLVITSGGKEIKDYVSLGQANLGITSSGEIPIYTNMSLGGLGIFSSTSKTTRNNISLANITLDSLRHGSITKSLNFQ